MDRFDARLLLHEVPPRAPAPRAPSPSDIDLNALRYADMYAPLPQEPPPPQHYAPAYIAAEYTYDAYVPDDGVTQHDAALPAPSAAIVDDTPFVPRFSVPDALCDALPATRKQHKVCLLQPNWLHPLIQQIVCYFYCTSNTSMQIIQETASFVRSAGGQMEIVLRVRQGTTPQFSFLMPTDRLHPYYRWVLETDPQVSRSCHANLYIHACCVYRTRSCDAILSGMLPSQRRWTTHGDWLMPSVHRMHCTRKPCHQVPASAAGALSQRSSWCRPSPARFVWPRATPRPPACPASSACSVFRQRWR